MCLYVFMSSGANLFFLGKGKTCKTAVPNQLYTRSKVISVQNRRAKKKALSKKIFHMDLCEDAA